MADITRLALVSAVLLGACLKSGEGETTPVATAAGPNGGRPAGGEQPAADRPSATGAEGGDARPAKRLRMVAADHPFHGRVEGDGFANDCKGDGDCFVGGCSGEVCSAEEGLITTCELLPIEWPEGRHCGCVEDTCVWWHESKTLPAPRAVPEPASGVDESPDRADEVGPSCGKRRCKPGEQCIEYYGIAGPQGPAFRECAIACKEGRPNDGCPTGMRCVMIADGPGPVCKKR